MAYKLLVMGFSGSPVRAEAGFCLSANAAMMPTAETTENREAIRR